LSLTALNRARMVVPGILLILALYPLAQLVDPTLEWSELLQADLKGGIYLLITVALGCMYNYLPLRNISNRPYHTKVNINLRVQALRALPQEERDINSYRWKHVRSIFYYFVDKDDSLKIQASRAYWNGLAWTTFADVRAIAGIFLVAYIVCYFVYDAMVFLFYAPVALVLFTVSFAFSAIATKRHIEIGNEQVEYILVHYSEALAEKLKQIAGRSD
jgi:hypothetical protein